MTSVPSSLTSLKCTFCTRGIEHTFYITCAVCTTPEVHLCVDCFSAGVNVGDHENCHPYRVPDCLDMPIFSKDWTIKEELLLLEGKKFDYLCPPYLHSLRSFRRSKARCRELEDYIREALTK